MSNDPPHHLTVVTGATSGIGRAIARMLVREGHAVLAVSRGGDALAALAHELGELAGPHAITTVVTDLASTSAPADVLRAVRRDGRSVGLLIHSAGIAEVGPLITEDAVGSFDRQMAINARAPLALTVALLPTLADGAARIVFVNSRAGLRTNRNWGAYSASKFALRAIADALREELLPRAIRVTSVYPGRTDSPMQRDVHGAEGRAYDPSVMLAPGDIAGVLRSIIALPPSAEVSDITFRPTASS